MEIKSEKIRIVLLTELQIGILALVEKIIDRGENADSERLVQRLEAMGILRDRPIEVLRQAGFGGPLHIRVGQTTELAIRQREAALITVRITDPAKPINAKNQHSEDRVKSLFSALSETKKPFAYKPLPTRALRELQ